MVIPRLIPEAPRRYLIDVPRPLHTAALVDCRRYLIVLPRPMPAPPLVVCCRYLAVLPRPLPAAPRRCRSRRLTYGQIYSRAE